MPSISVNSTILDAIMNELRMPVSNLTERTKIQRVVNGVYGDICAKSEWWWLLRKSNQFTIGTIDTGTISVTYASLTVTFSTTPLHSVLGTAVTVVPAQLFIPGQTQDPGGLYRFATHTAGTTTATLESPYLGATASGLAWKALFDTVELPTDVAKLLYVYNYQGQRMERAGIEDLNALKHNSSLQGPPNVYSIYDFATTGDASTNRLLQFYPYPIEEYTKLEVWYKHQQQGDTSTDLDLPLDFQQVLIYGGLARCYPIFLNDLERGTFYQSLFNDVMALMTIQQREYASDHPGIGTDMRLYRNASTRGRTRASLGVYFDRLPYAP